MELQEGYWVIVEGSELSVYDSNGVHLPFLEAIEVGNDWGNSNTKFASANIRLLVQLATSKEEMVKKIEAWKTGNQSWEKPYPSTRVSAFTRLKKDLTALWKKITRWAYAN